MSQQEADRLRIESFVAEKRAALLSLDEKQIRDFVRKYNKTEMPSDPIPFWGAVHKTITGCTGLPLEFRKKSKAWLDAHGMRSLDDGDL